MSETLSAEMSRISEMIQRVKDNNGDVVLAMPNKAVTPGQRKLQRKHGTPRAFAQACINSIGEISTLESHTAICKYRCEWDAAQ